MKKHFLCVIAALFATMPMVNAKQKSADYQRSSLSMVLVTTEEKTTSDEVMGWVSNSWQKYEFPAQYNQHEIGLKEFSAGKPKGGMMEVIRKYSAPDAVLPTDVNELKDLLEALQGGNKYIASLQEIIDAKVAKEKLAHKMVASWYGIQEDGSFNYDLIKARACYNASVSDFSEASDGAVSEEEAIARTGEALIENTFVSFIALSFFENEPVANLVKKIMYAVGDASGNQMAIMAARLAADKLYDATKEGYNAQSFALLYQLQWNDSINEVVKQCINNETGKFDMKQFYALDLKLTYLGADKANTITMMKKGENAESLARTAIVRNMDKQFVNLQKSYPVFRPCFPLALADPKQQLVAEMGTKEGIVGGETFELLQQKYNKLKNRIEWTRVATVKVDKKQVWDNQFDATAENVNTEENEGTVVGTRLSKCKLAKPGMVVKFLK